MARSILFALLLVAPVALAQPAGPTAGYPSRTITFVVPYAAGGFGDIRARRIGEKLSKSLGVPVVIDNKAGAGGVLGTNVVAKAAPDGYTIGMGNLAPLAVNGALMKKLPYDPVKDLEPVILLEKAPLILTASNAQGLGSVQAGKVRAIAVSGTKRIALLPDVPTLSESGVPGFESYNWQGIIVPRGTPAPIIARLSREMNAILQQPDVRESILASASEPAGGSPEDFAAFIRSETAKWTEVVKAANIRAE
jgi:tripartite-type tricarboxylate transporter receptor subunit TctC